jgi:DNA-binding transcriptional regulator YiaG
MAGIRVGRHDKVFKQMTSPTPADIIARRTENNLSQVAAARMVCVTVSTWRAWEYGQNPMHPGLYELFLLKLLLK